MELVLVITVVGVLAIILGSCDSGYNPRTDPTNMRGGCWNDE